MKDLSVLIMAAGKGTRMVSNRAKVLHPLCGTPMLRLIYRASAGLEPDTIVVVIGQDADQVRAALEGLPAEFVLQSEQLGTGHALMMARPEIEGRRGDLLVLSGDTPRLKPETLRRLVEHHRQSGASATLLTATAENPYAYGRILRSADGSIEAIVEEKDASEAQRQIQEINAGFYCFQIPPLLEALEKISNRNAQGEYYLTDLVEILRWRQLRVEALLHPDFEELRGINTRKELADLSQALREQKNQELMAAGVTLVDPGRTYIDLEVTIQKDVVIHPMVTLQGTTQIGEGSVVHSGTRIANSVIGPEVEILDSCLITDSEVGQGTTMGPCAHLRANTTIGRKCRVGNFVEIKKSTLGDGSKAAHLAYLGNATIGRNVNVGAGVITCNYDGVRKHATIIEDEAFIGTDSQLVAPVRVGRGAYVAAGSCITEDVPPGALGIARSRQAIKEDWVKRWKESKQSG
jgi:bifunctional UDP-N-acetylglucosamine pyrophosphorylase / glucosamine-1-phosphate N-acetyltransferase